MRIKSYYANAVADAMQAARREMGEDAILVETRKAPPEPRHLGAHEVVFALTGTEQGATASLVKPVAAPLSAGDVRSAPRIRSSRDAAADGGNSAGYEIRTNGAALADAILRFGGSLFSTLLAADFSSEIAQAIVDRLHATLPPSESEDSASLAKRLAGEMERRIAFDPTLGRGNSKPSVAALVGPPGAGKTTTLVKLAVRYGLHTRRGMHLISLWIQCGSARPSRYDLRGRSRRELSGHRNRARLGAGAWSTATRV